MSKLKAKIEALRKLKVKKGKKVHKVKKKSEEELRMAQYKKQCKVEKKKTYVFKKDGTIEAETPMLIRRKVKRDLNFHNIGDAIELSANLLLTELDPYMAKSLSSRFYKCVLDPHIRNERGAIIGKAFMLKQEKIEQWVISQMKDINYMRANSRLLALSAEC